MIDFKFVTPGSGKSSIIFRKTVHHAIDKKIILIVDRIMLNSTRSRFKDYNNVVVKPSETDIYSEELKYYDMFVYDDMLPSMDMFKFVHINNKGLIFRGSKSGLVDMLPEIRDFLIEFYPEAVI